MQSLRQRYEAARREWREESRKRKRLTKRRPNGHRERKELQEVQRLLNRNAAEWTVSKPADNVHVLRRQLTTECTISIVYPPNEKADGSSGGSIAEDAESCDEHVLPEVRRAESVKEEQSLEAADERGKGPAEESEWIESPPNALTVAGKAEIKSTPTSGLDPEHEKTKRDESIPPASHPASEAGSVSVPRSSTNHPATASSSILQLPQIPSPDEPVHTTHQTHTHSSINTTPTFPSESSTTLPLPLSPSTVHPPNLPPRATDFVDSWLHTISSAAGGAGGEWAKLEAQRPYEADQWHVEDLAVGESAGVLEERWGSETGVSSRKESKNQGKEASVED